MGATERATAIQAPADGKDTTFRVGADDRLALSRHVGRLSGACLSVGSIRHASRLGSPIAS